MAMLRAMDAAVAGLKAHQNKLDVIGNNLANVNTFGFKAQTYTFKESLYQTSTSSTKGSTKSGGVNAAQYGYGSVTGAISMNMTPSSGSQADGLNAMINGDGFFITLSVPNAECSREDLKGDDAPSFLYTRVGQFQIDSNGYLTDLYGNYVYGFAAGDVDTNGNIKYEETNLTALRVPNADGTQSDPTDPDDEVGKLLNVSIDRNGVVKGTMEIDDVEKVVYLGKVGVATFQNPNGLTKEDGGYYSTSATDNAGQAGAAWADGKLTAGVLESSNVDVSKEFTEMITAQRGFQANSRIITVSDEMLSELMNMKR